MFNATSQRPFAIVAVVVGLLAAAGPASAGTAVGNPGDPPAKNLRPRDGICAFPDVCKTPTQGFWLGSNDALGVLYNGHAGLGADALDIHGLITN